MKDMISTDEITHADKVLVQTPKEINLHEFMGIDKRTVRQGYHYASLSTMPRRRMGSEV